MIDLDSPPGAWRAALQQAGVCALCRQHVCGHSDLEYQGIVPASPACDPSDDAASAAVLSAADARRALRGSPPNRSGRAASTSVPPSHVQENARG